MSRAKMHLDRALKELAEAIESYDSGQAYKAYQMSALCYLLLYDGGKSTSLAKQVGIKRRLQFPNWEYAGSFRLGFPTLSLLVGNQKDGIFASPAKVKKQHGSFDFKSWWISAVIVQKRKTVLTRGDILKVMRDQDGGAHIDPNIRNEAYEALISKGMPTVSYYVTDIGLRLLEQDEFGWATLHFVEEAPPDNCSPKDIAGPFPVRNIAEALMRQVSREVAEAFARLDDISGYRDDELL